MERKLTGTGVALATPMSDDLSVDYDSLAKLIKHVSDGGVDYLVVNGTTAESPTLTESERFAILDFVLENNESSLPVVFGLGGNNTAQLIAASKQLANYPLEAILSVSPYYNRPSQVGIIRHFEMLADQFPHPVILYNVPARTGSNMEATTTLHLANHPNIIAMKEASGILRQAQQIINEMPDNFCLLSGNDENTLDLIKNGAHGVISVVANLMPTEFSEMVHAALAGKGEAEELDHQLSPIYDQLKKEGNPVSLKTALAIKRLAQDKVRPPLIEGSEKLSNEWRSLLTTIHQEQ